MQFISRAWRGEERLWKIFWIFGPFSYLVFSNVLPFLPPVLPSILPPVVVEPATWCVAGLSILITFIWGIWWAVAAWRCAFNADWEGWGYFIRFFSLIVMLMLLGLLLGLIVGGSLWGLFRLFISALGSVD